MGGIVQIPLSKSPFLDSVCNVVAFQLLDPASHSKAHRSSCCLFQMRRDQGPDECRLNCCCCYPTVPLGPTGSYWVLLGVCRPKGPPKSTKPTVLNSNSGIKSGLEQPCSGNHMPILANGCKICVLECPLLLPGRLWNFRNTCINTDSWHVICCPLEQIR